MDDNTLTVNIARLRKHLEEAGLTGFITTKKGLVIWWRNKGDAAVFDVSEEPVGSSSVLF